MNKLLSDFGGCFRPQTFVAFLLAALHERDFNSDRNSSGIPNTIWHMVNEYFGMKELKEARQNNATLDRVLGVMKDVILDRNFSLRQASIEDIINDRANLQVTFEEWFYAVEPNYPYEKLVRTQAYWWLRLEGLLGRDGTFLFQLGLNHTFRA